MKLKEEERKEKSERASRAKVRFDEVQFEVARDGVKFFDRLGLLCAGAVVLSVTFLGYITSRHQQPVIYMNTLYAVWGFLLVGLLAAQYRNFYHLRDTYYTMFSAWAKKIVELKDSEITVVQTGWPVVDAGEGTPLPTGSVVADLEKEKISWTQAKDKAEKSAHVSERVFRICEYTAHGGLVLGLILMVFFAVANTP